MDSAAQLAVSVSGFRVLVIVAEAQAEDVQKMALSAIVVPFDHLI